MRARDFTLLELVLVLAIVALATLLGAGAIGRGMEGFMDAVLKAFGI